MRALKIASPAMVLSVVIIVPKFFELTTIDYHGGISSSTSTCFFKMNVFFLFQGSGVLHVAPTDLMSNPVYQVFRMWYYLLLECLVPYALVILFGVLVSMWLNGKILHWHWWQKCT